MRIAHPVPSRPLISATHHYLSLIFISEKFPKPQFRSHTLISFSLQQIPALTVRRSLSMASDNVSTLSNADDEKYGFRRSEMYQSNLAGTVDPYDRHVFLCFQSPEEWGPRVEDSEADLLPKLLSSAVKARKNDITVKTKLTVCEGREGTEFSDGDVLIFPEMIKYRGLKESDVDSFVEDVFVNSKPWASGAQEVLSGSHVFVCAHGSRDRRCGVCGPILIEKLNEEIESRGLKDQVWVSPCSHVGGHKYAGNLIIYGPGPDGKIMGHWYGYVTPEDVPELLDQHIAKGEIVERLWRGQLGGNTDEGKKEKGQEHKLPNGEGIKSKNTPQENGVQSNKETVTGCCQGANGFTCCQDVSTKKSSEIKAKAEEISEAHGKKKLGKLSCWVGTWEQSDILAAAAVVGAVATVAVAYSLYRRSG